MFHYLIKHKFIVSLFITSLLPLWIAISFIELFSILDANNLYKTTEYIVILSIVLINLLCIFYLNKKLSQLKKQKEPSQKISNVIKEKSITTEYLLSCILPLLAFDFTNWKQILIFLIFFATLSFLCLRNKNVYANIFLEFQKYNFYTCELVNLDNVKSTVTVISKNNLSKKVNKDICFARIDDEVFLDVTTTF